MSLKPGVSSSDHIQGNSQAEIELVEYGDYECPYCRRAHYEVKKVQQELGDKLKFVFRNFPLENVHPYALHAATAAEVAASFDKFWEMHDILYNNQESLGDSDLVDYARELGINEKKFETEFPEMKYADKIEADLESGLRSGVNGTPSFFVNGQKYNGDYTADAILEFLQSI